MTPAARAAQYPDEPFAVKQTDAGERLWCVESQCHIKRRALWTVTSTCAEIANWVRNWSKKPFCKKSCAPLYCNFYHNFTAIYRNFPQFYRNFFRLGGPQSPPPQQQAGGYHNEQCFAQFCCAYRYATLFCNNNMASACAMTCTLGDIATDSASFQSRALHPGIWGATKRGNRWATASEEHGRWIQRSWLTVKDSKPSGSKLCKGEHARFWGFLRVLPTLVGVLGKAGQGSGDLGCIWPGRPHKIWCLQNGACRITRARLVRQG